MDRFPDLLVPIADVNGTTRVELWENVPCTSDRCSADAVTAERRTFRQMLPSLTSDLLAMTGAFVGAPFDLDETGRLDIILLSVSNDSSFSVGALFNNFFNDAYFLKTLGLNGVCTINCGIGKTPDPKPYGVNRHGATFKFSMTDLSGTPQSGIAVQLSQSSHLALQTPYTVSGLGRPSNYVDYVYFGVAIAPTTKRTCCLSEVGSFEAPFLLRRPPNQFMRLSELSERRFRIHFSSIHSLPLSSSIKQ